MGSLFYFMDSCEEQELKEAVLAYFFLWRYGPLNKGDLDILCERFLKEECGLELNYDVEDALRKLMVQKLVFKVHAGIDQLSMEEVLLDHNSLFIVIPIEDAIARLDFKWQHYFVNSSH